MARSKSDEAVSAMYRAVKQVLQDNANLTPERRVIAAAHALNAVIERQKRDVLEACRGVYTEDGIKLAKDRIHLLCEKERLYREAELAAALAELPPPKPPYDMFV